MNQIIEVSEQQLEMIKKAGIVPKRTINPYEALFETLIHDAANMIETDYDCDTMDEIRLNSSRIAKELYDKVFYSNTNEYGSLIEATASIYERVEKEVVEIAERETALLQEM